MGIVVTGASCATTVASPLGTSAFKYYRQGSASGTKMISINNGQVAVSDFSVVFAGIKTKTLNTFRLKLWWSSTIIAPTSPPIATTNSPLLIGDIRLRYLYSEHDYPSTAPTDSTNCILVFLPNPDVIDKFIIFEPSYASINLSDTSPVTTRNSYISSGVSPTFMFYPNPSPASIGAANLIRPMFLVESSNANNTRFYLDQYGEHYDVNQPLANLKRIRAWNFVVLIDTDASGVQTGYRIEINGLPSASVMASNNLDTASTNTLFTSGSYTISITKSTITKIYIPITTLTQDIEFINRNSDNEYKIFYHVSPSPGTSTSVMGWDDSTASDIKLKFYTSYYQTISTSTTGLRLGFLNLLPLTPETSTTAYLRYFMLLLSTNSHYLKLTEQDGGNVIYSPADSSISSITIARTSVVPDSTSAIQNLNTYGAWTFENITSPGSTGSGTFNLAYTPPYSTTGLITTASTGANTGSIAAQSSKWYLGYDGTTYKSYASKTDSKVVTFMCAECNLNTDGVCELT